MGDERARLSAAESSPSELRGNLRTDPSKHRAPPELKLVLQPIRTRHSVDIEPRLGPQTTGLNIDVTVSLG